MSGQAAGLRERNGRWKRDARLMHGDEAMWRNRCEALIGEELALLDVAEAAKDAKDWVLLPSDVYGHQQERLGEVRKAFTEALSRLEAVTGGPK